jgi:hypothetical protein
MPNLSPAGPVRRIARSRPATLRCLLLTLLCLQSVGLRRTWDVRSYTGQALALLTGRDRAYSYRHTERFLAELACVSADVPLTSALARWTASLWEPRPERRESPVPVFYVDGHRKPIYADAALPTRIDWTRRPKSWDAVRCWSCTINKVILCL